MCSFSRSEFLYTFSACGGTSWVALVENDLFPKSLKDFERGASANPVTNQGSNLVAATEEALDIYVLHLFIMGLEGIFYSSISGETLY